MSALAAVLPWAELAALLLLLAVVVVLLVWRRVDRQARVVTDPGDVWYGRPYAAGVDADPVDEHAATTPLFDVPALRLLAAEDGAAAAFATPGKRRVDAFLAELFPRTERKP